MKTTNHCIGSLAGPPTGFFYVVIIAPLLGFNAWVIYAQDSMVSLGFRVVPFGVRYEVLGFIGWLDDEPTVVPRGSILVKIDIRTLIVRKI